MSIEQSAFEEDILKGGKNVSMIDLSDEKFATMMPKDFRRMVRRGEFKGPTLNACGAYARTAMTIVPKEIAFDFSLFCQRNPGLVPVIDVTDPGSPHPMRVAPDADLRTDLSGYDVWVNGKLEAEVSDITAYWRDDLVGFLTGCSRGLDAVLVAANINYRYIGVYSTSIRCVSAGCFHGPIIVTCRLIKGGRDAVRTIQIASRHPCFHGPPIHIGDPAIIGIKDLHRPDVLSLSETIAPQQPDEVAMFWPCGMTLKEVARESQPPLMITEGAGNLFITDRFVGDLAVIS